MPALVDLETQRRHAFTGVLRIGRGADNDLQIDDPLISVQHAEITAEVNGRVSVRDLGSRRGVFVGSQRISGETVLQDGDELMLGPTRLRFESGEGEQVPVDREELVRLRAVVALGRAVGVEHDLGKLCERVLDTCFELFGADRGAVVVYEPHSKSPFLTVAIDNQQNRRPFAVSTNLLGQVMLEHKAYLRTEVDADLVLQRSQSLHLSGVRSVMAVPLAYEASETEWIGVVVLDSRAQARTFSPRDLELLEAIAGQAALAIKNALLVRKVESVVSEEWRRLDGVVRDLPLGVVVLDENRVCTMANRWVSKHPEAGAIAVGAVVEAIAGIACDQLVGSDLHTSATIGERAYTLAAITSGRETVVVITDITDERERQTREAHKDRVALIGQLAGGIAHDFNNLLQVILACSQCLVESLHGTPDAEDAEQIVHAATSASELTRQLLSFSRRELVTAKVVDVATVVKGMERLLRRTLGSSVELVVKLGQRIPRILMDSAQLDQILMNLVVNARDAIVGTGRVILSVDAHDQAGTQHVLIEVSDTGAGMRPDVAARVFEPYFTTKALGKGTGLGLATVHGIVQQARGEITVTSVLAVGTTFRIVLPATDQTPESKRSSLIPVPTGSTILVVDDDDAVRNVTERFLRNAGYAVLSASSGQAALALSREHKGAIDLLLTDVVMPGQSGRDLAQELQRERNQTRVLFMSGYHHQSPIGSSQFIAKPFGRDALLEKVKDSLAREVDRA